MRGKTPRVEALFSNRRETLLLDLCFSRALQLWSPLQLQSVTLDRINTSTEFVTKILAKCSKLQHLTLIDGNPISISDVDELIQVRQSVKQRKQTYTLAPMVVNLINIRQYQCFEAFSADDAAITKWVDGDEPNYLNQVWAAFRRDLSGNSEDEGAREQSRLF